MTTSQGSPHYAPIIDSHVHIYNPGNPSREIHEKEGIPFPTTADDVRTVAGTHGVAGVVVIETTPELAENRSLLALADRDPYIIAVVGNLDAGKPGFAGRLREYATNRRFRGIRIGTPWCPFDVENAQLLTDLQHLADAGLAADIVKVGGGDTALLRAADTAAGRVKGLRIVLDHLPFGAPDDAMARRTDREELARLSEREHVYVKVSNMLPRRGAIPDDLTYYAKILDELLALFGPERLMYGSNWPISARVAPYDRALSVVAEYFRRQDSVVAAKFFRHNVRAAYGLP